MYNIYEIVAISATTVICTILIILKMLGFHLLISDELESIHEILIEIRDKIERMKRM